MSTLLKEHKANFTQTEYEQARSVNILDFLQRNGYEIEKNGREFQLKIHDSLKIKPTGEWFWHSRQIGGKSPIELLKQLENIGDVEAIKRLCGNSYEVASNESAAPPKTNKNLKLPKRNPTNKHVFAYLNKTRYIDPDIISYCFKNNKIYESADHHNAVFVATYKDGVVRFATLRGTSTYGKPFRRDVEGSDKSYPFALEGKNNRLYIFESCVDLLSHATLFKIHNEDWQDDHRISLSGMSNDSLPRYLKDNPQIDYLIFCLDNDKNATYANGNPAPNWGQMRATKLHDEYSALGYDCSIEMPINKDVNEDLMEMMMQSEKGDLENEEDEEMY